MEQSLLTPMRPQRADKRIENLNLCLQQVDINYIRLYRTISLTSESSNSRATEGKHRILPIKLHASTIDTIFSGTRNPSANA